MIFGVIGYLRVAGERLAERRLPDHSGQRGAAGRQSGNDGLGGGDAARKAVRDDLGVISSISSTNSQGSTNITLQFDLDRDIDAAAQDVQVRDLADRPAAAAGHAGAAVAAESEPGRRADPVPDAELADAAALRRERVRGNPHRAADLDAQGRGAGRRSSARRNTRCGSTSIRASWRRATSTSNRWRTAVARGSVNRPTGTLYGPDRTFAVKTDGQLTNAAGFRPLVVAYRDGRPVRLDEVAQRLRRRRERQDGELVQRHAHDLPRDQPAAGHQHRRDRRFDPRSCCRRSQSAAAGRAVTGRSAATGRSRSASPSTTSSSRSSSPSCSS